METNRSPSINAGFGTTFYVALLMAGLMCGGTAVGATTTKADCGTFSKSVTQRENPVEALSINLVDHARIEKKDAAIDALEASAANSESAAPFLYLTPRVASVLQDIFDAARTDTVELIEQEVISSPVADVDKSVDAEAVDGEVDLPLLQRQMFRTDI